MCGAGSQIEQDSLGVELAECSIFKLDFHAVRVQKTSASTHEIDSWRSEEFLVCGNHCRDDTFLVCAQLFYVDVSAGGTLDTKGGIRASIFHAASCSDQGLSGDTRHVNAGTTDKLSFDQGNLPAFFGAIHRQ